MYIFEFLIMKLNIYLVANNQVWFDKLISILVSTISCFRLTNPYHLHTNKKGMQLSNKEMKDTKNLHKRKQPKNALANAPKQLFHRLNGMIIRKILSNNCSGLYGQHTEWDADSKFQCAEYKPQILPTIPGFLLYLCAEEDTASVLSCHLHLQPDSKQILQ